MADWTTVVQSIISNLHIYSGVSIIWSKFNCEFDLVAKLWTVTDSAHGDVTWQIHFVIIIFWVEHKGTVRHSETVHAKVFVVFRSKWTGNHIDEKFTRYNGVRATIFNDIEGCASIIRNSTFGDFVLQVRGEFSWDHLKSGLNRRYLRPKIVLPWNNACRRWLYRRKILESS